MMPRSRATARGLLGRGLIDDEFARFQPPTPLKFDFAKRQCLSALGN
jgi:hypothetical protein